MTEIDLSQPPVDIPQDFGKPDHTKSRERGPVRRVRAAAKKAATETETKPKAKKGAFVEPLEQIYTGFGITLMPFDQQCATTVVENAHRCAEAWDDLADKNDTIRKALTAFVETSAWGQLIFAHAPILLAVASHHMPGRQAVEAEAPEDIASMNGQIPYEPAR